ncbi:hypothetical protein QZM97_19690 [Burkholderia orbicola]|uniref:Uncharacterized protein n=2 Tax=Burkholderia cepacia complex TaxID=87882 RepID=A0ABD4U6A5_9BURK|nr:MULTISPECIES: hypothetical protein [Burkholderia]MCW3694350.1 hypothetical protein [Burkholderia cenocepacia]MCW3702423.1 hypothetical protein [Burkholderia cenocepacia]MCW3709694.1 hypothetical protein [Burkholderia cenocepacia]MCW3718305.1 hypothetical protein [Burkholderia cenocepacia]MCW3726562.1 hypothetical protein [Burkholderia cenocepacia]
MSLHTDFAFDLLDAVTGIAPDDFNGLGVLFYLGPLRLPVVPLGDQTLFDPALPVGGFQQIAQVLASISTVASVWHDGFHLIDVETTHLTHVSQFFSPPIDILKASVSQGTPIGARQLAAVAGSRMDAVVCAGLLSKNADPIVFSRGVRVGRRRG